MFSDGMEGFTMIGHPDRSTLEGFLRSRLPAPVNKAVLLHLLSGCPQCRGGLEPLSAAMFAPGASAFAAAAELAPELDAAYDQAISAAFSSLGAPAALPQRPAAPTREKIDRLLAGGPLPEEAGFWTPDLCVALLERSRELRTEDPAAMLRLAELARQAADRLEPKLLGARETADLRIRAWAELANAHRVNDDLPQAEAAMARALELQGKGTAAPLLLARIADLSASLFCDQRRFAEAFRMLDTAHILYRQQGETHEAGRVLIMKGLYTGYTGNPEEGLQLLSQGLDAIDRERDPRLVFQTLHNVLLFRVELGEFAEAQQQLQRMRPLYERHAGRIERVKLDR